MFLTAEIFQLPNNCPQNHHSFVKVASAAWKAIIFCVYTYMFNPMPLYLLISFLVFYYTISTKYQAYASPYTLRLAANKQIHYYMLPTHINKHSYSISMLAKEQNSFELRTPFKTGTYNMRLSDSRRQFLRQLI